jgi:hypothetical protein
MTSPISEPRSRQGPSPPVASTPPGARRRQRRNRMIARAIAALCILATGLAFAVAGALTAGLSADTKWQASALVRLVGTLSASPLPPEQANRVVQSQVLVFGTRAFETSVRQRLASDAPFSLDIEQIGTTDIVRVRANAAQPRIAERAADTAAKLVVQRTVDATLADLRQQEVTLQRRVDGLSEPSGDGGGVRSPPADVLESELKRLAEVTSELDLAVARSAELASVVVSAADDGASKGVSTARRALVWGLVGLLVAVGVVLFIQRSSAPAGRNFNMV